MFDVGDVVKVKVGGPEMVVIDNTKGDWSDSSKCLITCIWMANGLKRQEDFPALSIELVENK